MRKGRHRSGGRPSTKRFLSWFLGNNAMLQSSGWGWGVTEFKVCRDKARDGAAAAAAWDYVANGGSCGFWVPGRPIKGEIEQPSQSCIKCVKYHNNDILLPGTHPSGGTSWSGSRCGWAHRKQLWIHKREWPFPRRDRPLRWHRGWICTAPGGGERIREACFIVTHARTFPRTRWSSVTATCWEVRKQTLSERRQVAGGVMQMSDGDSRDCFPKSFGLKEASPISLLGGQIKRRTLLVYKLTYTWIKTWNAALQIRSGWDLKNSCLV